MWILVFVAIALLYAGLKTGKAIGKSIGNFYNKEKAKRVLAADAVEAGHAPNAAKLGAALGAGAAATISGPRLAWTAFWANWAKTWAEGWKRAKEVKDGTVPVKRMFSDREPEANSGPPDAGGAECIAREDKNGQLLAACGAPTVKNSPYCQRHWDDWHVTGDADGFVVHARCRTCGALNVPGLDQCWECIGAEADARRASTCQSCGKSLEGEEIGERRPGWCCACTAKYAPGCIGEAWLSESNTYAQCNAQTVPGSPYCRGHLDEIEAEPAAPASAPIATEGTSTMPIETATGGEILTKDQFVKEMQALRAEQVAELEDAQAAEKHAMENNSRIEVMAASMSRLEISDQVVADVRQLADSTAAVQRLSQDRIKAAELRITAIDNALKSLDQSGQNQFFAA